MRMGRKIFLQNKMVEDQDKFIDFLFHCGFKNPRYIGENKVRMGWGDSSSGNSTVVDTERMTFKRFSALDSEFTLFDMIAKKLDLDEDDTNDKIVEFFNIQETSGIDFKLLAKSMAMKKSISGRSVRHEDYEKLDESKVGRVEPCRMFLRDNISIETQIFFKIHYRSKDKRIMINWRDKDGALVGFVGRTNVTGFLATTSCKYFTYGNFKKGLHLFGFYENKESILEKKTVIVSESEKATMQMHSYGMKIGVSVGSSSLTIHQIDLLNKQGVKNIILNFDKDKDLEHIKNTHKLIMKIHPKAHVFYIDTKNTDDIGDKANICDYGEEKFYEYFGSLMRDCDKMEGINVKTNYEVIEED